MTSESPDAGYACLGDAREHPDKPQCWASAFCSDDRADVNDVRCPPGLSKPSQLHENDVTLSDLQTLVYGCVEKLDEVAQRVLRIEAVLMTADFAEFAKVDAFLRSAMNGKSNPNCEFFTMHEDSENEFANEASGIVDFDALNLLTDMVVEPVARPVSLIGDGALVESSFGTSALIMKRSEQHRHEYNVCQVKQLCRIMDAIGTRGDVKGLDACGLIVPGTLLESTEYLHVTLQGFNGIRYTTDGPTVRIREVADDRGIVFTDASVTPSLDRRGHRVFGNIRPDDCQFILVGHERGGGPQIQFGDL